MPSAIRGQQLSRGVRGERAVAGEQLAVDVSWPSGQFVGDLETRPLEKD
ncbi:hypothetical protein K0651_10300 [Ornithinimicrobium sp. Arc0846-15]|nr:hypothetical protein [Ornithinimicrobium laminariae]